MASQEPEMSSETSGGRCLRTKARRHYDEGEHQDDEIEGRRTFTLHDKIDEERYTSDLVRHMDGKELNFRFFQEHGFDTPMVFRKPEGLGLKMPEAAEFDVNDVRQHVGSRRVVDCMDVTTQKAETMTMAQFAKYFQNPERERLLNVISLEFSHTRLDDMVHAPAVVKQIDWVDTVWPRHLKQTQTETTNIIADMKYPKVQKYCLMSVANCYTDFHVDFGGTSVWYHLLHGEKIFWLIPPTQKNLDMYQAWVLSGKQGEIFLGERVAECSMIRLKAGNTFMIPSGWIHAVYTPEDSLVFGGNILHSFAIDRQLKVNTLEDNTHVPHKFRYPFFWEINWYCLERYVNSLMGKSFLKPVPEEAHSRRNSEEGNEENILPSGVKLERKDSTDSDKTIEVGLPGAKHEDDDDRSSTFTEPRTPKTEHSRSSTPTKSSSISPGQNGHSTEDTSSQVDSVKDEDGGQSSKVKGLLSSYEKKGLIDLIRALAGLPESKRCVPDMITDADALLQEAREMMKIHEGDDPLAALTGEPIIKAPKEKTRKFGSSSKPTLCHRPPAKKPPTGLRKRRTKCRKCVNCLRDDCKVCNFCKDMKKYGGAGKMKQSCKEKRCSNPQLPGNTFCRICEGDEREDPSNTLMECHQCNEVTHPECLRERGFMEEGIINEDMGNSWECPKCIAGEIDKMEEAGAAGDAVHRSTPPPSRQVLKRKQVFQEPPSPESEPEPEPEEKQPPRKRRQGRPPGKVQTTHRQPAPKRYSYPHRTDNGVFEGEDEDSMDSPPVLIPKKIFRGRGGRFGYRRGGRASMVSYHQQRLAKQKVQQAKYHSIRGARRRRGRNLRLQANPRRHKANPNQAEPSSTQSSSDISSQVPPLRQEEDEEDIRQQGEDICPVESPTHPRMTPLTIPALEPEVVLMEKAKPTHAPMYVVRPAPISPPPSTFMLENDSFHVITHDTWMKVFRNLPQRDLCRCMQVCKIWNRWCLDPSLWRSISIAKMTPIPATALRGLVLRQPRCLDLNWTNISKQHIMWLLARLPGLRGLFLQGSSWDAVSALCSSICPPLRLLDLTWVSGIKDSTLNTLLSPITNHRPGMVDDQCHLRFLTELRLTGSDVTDTSMKTLSDCTPKLEKLILQYCHKVTDEGVRILAAETSPIRTNLTELNIANNNSITDACILSLRRFTRLKRVAVHSCPEINRDSWAFYSTDTGVEVLLIRPPRPARTARSSTVRI